MTSNKKKMFARLPRSQFVNSRRFSVAELRYSNCAEISSTRWKHIDDEKQKNRTKKKANEVCTVYCPTAPTAQRSTVETQLSFSQSLVAAVAAGNSESIYFHPGDWFRWMERKTNTLITCNLKISFRLQSTYRIRVWLECMQSLILFVIINLALLVLRMQPYCVHVVSYSFFLSCDADFLRPFL